MTAAGLRILIVEDEALIAMMAEDLLESIGCVVTAVAGTIADGLAAVERGEFDVAMLDVNLDGEPSMAIADAVRATGRPYVFTTGYGQDGVSPDHAAAPVLAKPYVLADLERALIGCASQVAGASSMTSTSDSNAG